MDQKAHPFLTLPGAIVIAATIIAIAVIWTRRPAPAPVPSAPATAEASISPVTAADHIFGNPNAPVKIVEYSDASCPFCKTFHPTMEKIMAEYGPTGNVAWVYRHFPLDKPDQNGRVLHPNAGTEAQAMECAAALGGNDAFWAYTNKLYEITPSVTQATPAGLDPSELPEIARTVGLDVISFNECLTSGRFKDKVDQSYVDGLNAGVSGTPYSVIVTPSGSTIPVAGALPYATIKSTIDALVSGL